MECPFCGGTVAILNPHWNDPFVECSCQIHLMRLSELEAHNGTDSQLQSED